MTSSIGKDICLKGWKERGMQEALENGLDDNLDHFKDIDPIETADEVSNKPVRDQQKVHKPTEFR